MTSAMYPDIKCSLSSQIERRKLDILSLIKVYKLSLLFGYYHHYNGHYGNDVSSSIV